MNGGRFPHCPIAPGRGCPSCHDIEDVVQRARLAEWKRAVLTTLAILAVAGAALMLGGAL